MMKSLRVAGLLLSMVSWTAGAGAETWQSVDLGITIPGSTTISSTGTFTIAGDGADLWGTGDRFRFVYLRAKGDCEMMVRVLSQVRRSGWSKAGVMIRQEITSGSAHVSIVRSPDNGIQFLWRSVAGGTSSGNNGGSNTVPRWLWLRRRGNTFSGFNAADAGGRPGMWVQQGTNVTVTMSDPVYIGFAVSSVSYGVLSTAVFDSVATTGTMRGAGFIIGDTEAPPPISRLLFSSLRFRGLFSRVGPPPACTELDPRRALALASRTGW